MVNDGAGRPTLHELLLERRTAILNRFVAASRAQGLPPEGATRQGILDHLHAFLSDMATTLRRETLGPSSSATPEGEAARVHGAQRWGLGYDLPDMVREYGVLRRCIFETIAEAGFDLDLHSFDRIADLLNLGIAEAVDEFVRRKDEALRSTREEALTIVAHDLRGPLQVVAGAVTLLRETLGEPGRGDAQTTKLLDGIERATSTMNELIAGLLDLSRLEAGRLPLTKGLYEVSALLAEAAERARPLAERARQRIDVAASPPGTARCDRERTLQVLANLVGNAIKFTPPGGTIGLSAERVEGGWRLAVSDTGPGIPADQRPLLFERFWQAPETRHQGTGLGLAIAKGLVEAQDGSIGIESEPGRGSVFFFTLPGAP
jgi:signal transduction histidine kinase